MGIGKRLLERYEWWRFQPLLGALASAPEAPGSSARGEPSEVRRTHPARFESYRSAPVEGRGAQGQEHRMSVVDWNPQERLSPFAAGIPGRVWVIYLTTDSLEGKFAGLKGKSIALEPGAQYRAYFHNPRTGADHAVGAVRPDAKGHWRIPQKPSREDWVLVLEQPPQP